MTHFGLIDWNVVALETVQALYPVPASDEPSLGTCSGPQRKGKKRTPDAERESIRRKDIRELYEELSKFYELPAKATTWKCPGLLAKGKLGCDHSTS